jgi:tetratricopeptide (TPR) repeat protein
MMKNQKIAINKVWLVLSILGLLLIDAGWCRADETEQVERSMQFIDQSFNATELYNAGEVEKALTIFQELLVTNPDLDEDGYVALSVGDCLAALGRIQEARDAYHAAVASHPDLNTEVNRRLVELDLIGNVNDDLIATLRCEVQQRDSDPYTSNLQLGRALEKRAEAMLKESISAFRAAFVVGSSCLGNITQNHVAALEDLTDDLEFNIEQLESYLNQLGRKKNIKTIETEKKTPSVAIEKQHWRWNSRIEHQPAVSIEIKINKDGNKEILADGQAIKLTPTQELLIRRHEQRINQIILEAAGKFNKPLENKQ